MIFRAKLLCVAAVSCIATAAAMAPAQALSSQECSAKYKQAKAAGTLNGQKWNDFRKAECGADATAAAPAAAARPPLPHPQRLRPSKRRKPRRPPRPLPRR